MDGANVGANVRRSDGGSVAARFLVSVRGVDGRRARRRERQTFGRWIGCGAFRWTVRVVARLDGCGASCAVYGVFPGAGARCRWTARTSARCFDIRVIISGADIRA